MENGNPEQQPEGNDPMRLPRRPLVRTTTAPRLATDRTQWTGPFPWDIPAPTPELHALNHPEPDPILEKPKPRKPAASRARKAKPKTSKPAKPIQPPPQSPPRKASPEPLPPSIHLERHQYTEFLENLSDDDLARVLADRRARGYGRVTVPPPPATTVDTPYGKMPGDVAAGPAKVSPARSKNPHATKPRGFPLRTSPPPPRSPAARSRRNGGRGQGDSEGGGGEWVMRIRWSD